MGGNVRRSIVALMCAALSLVTFASLASAGPSSRMVTKKFMWVEPGALATTAKDTMYVTDEADTARSTVMDISDLDWDAVLQQSAGGAAGQIQADTSGAIVVAEIDFVVTQANNGVSDTLYWNIERGVGGVTNSPGSTNCASCRADTMFSYNGFFRAGVGGSFGPSQGSGSLGSGFSTVTGANTAGQYNANVFRGYIIANPHLRGRNDGMFLRRFRLVTAGDVGGATPKLSGVQGFITYYAKQ